MKAVYMLPFVNCDDPLWIPAYEEAYRDHYHLTRVRLQRERFEEFGYLRYLFRGVAECYPWIDEIVLLLSQPSQLPDWVNKETVKVIYHDRFIPAKYLPTYNSCTIEMFLTDVPTDADLILYGNDDFYPVSPLGLSDYFTPEGYPKVNYRHREARGLSMFADTCREMWSNCSNAHGIKPPEGVFEMPIHDIQPINVSMMKEAAGKYSRFMHSHLDKFRERHQSNQYIYANYARFTDRIAPSERRFRYYNTESATVGEVASAIRGGECDTIVVNDGGVDYNIWVRNPEIISAFESIFPEPCRYER